MANLRKIKVIKGPNLVFGQNPVFPQTAPKSEAVSASAARSKKAERELAKRVNDWVFDWRDRKIEKQFNELAAFLS